ncbi:MULTISPECIES: hypothetical protein [unclassified Nocardioides]|uniref:hypothetical protein n=1 Tax=unclassified Nocardioides TaxID=2615069 RepID=UPI00360F7B0F
MRIGTWNLAGRWTPDHERFLLDLDCDVLLLTEVSERFTLAGHHLHLSEALMAPRRRWAGVASRPPLTPVPDPHPASAMAAVDGWTFCSSILPWRSCGNRDPWQGTRHADKTTAAVERLLERLPTDRFVWGGDWNHALSGREWSGSIGGRTSILAALEKLGLDVPTALLPHRIEGLLSIDHIAVPSGTEVTEATAVDADSLSDHDAYVVELR